MPLWHFYGKEFYTQKHIVSVCISLAMDERAGPTVAVWCEQWNDNAETKRCPTTKYTAMEMEIPQHLFELEHWLY